MDANEFAGCLELNASWEGDRPGMRSRVAVASTRPMELNSKRRNSGARASLLELASSRSRIVAVA